jgi:signal transduction histidine kinase
LSICREIARAHDGDIVLHNDRANWTEFRVTLPCAPRPDDDTARVPPSRASAAATSFAAAQ